MGWVSQAEGLEVAQEPGRYGRGGANQPLLLIVRHEAAGFDAQVIPVHAPPRRGRQISARTKCVAKAPEFGAH